MRMTLFRQLLQEKDWTTAETFNQYFTEAARDLAAKTGERELADLTVPRRTLDHWLSGESQRPHRKTRRVLEHLFGIPVATLFRPPPQPETEPYPDPDPVHGTRMSQTGENPVLTAPMGPDTDTAGTLSTESLLPWPEDEPVDRRQLLRAGSIAVLPGLPDLPGEDRPARIPLDRVNGAQLDATLEHLRDMWHMLVRSDNLLGPRHALVGVHQQLDVLEGFLQSTMAPSRDEVLRLSARYAESAAWLHEDCADNERAAYWTRRAMEWAVEAGDETMTAWTLFRRAQQATTTRNAAQTISLSRAAKRYDRVLTPQMRAAILQQEAHGYALLGDEARCHGLIDQAVEFAAAPEAAGDGRSGHGDFATPAYLEGQRAYCWLLLRKPRRAAPMLGAALDGLPDVYQRDRGLAHARLAISYAQIGEIDQAVAEANTALTSARLSGSGRTLHETIRAVKALQPVNTHRGVAELIEAVAC
ncbi:hypothetical protein ABZX77_14970 [Streptomyces sp. NPDC004237]|uniref:hypothetical protein n=1 Tax=Streptomyces sp. NPDC004237 TaxID=3154455 RepID=UPI0033BAEC0B